MNELIYCGLVLGPTECSYFNVVRGKSPSKIEDPVTRTLTLTLPGLGPVSSHKLSETLGLKSIGRDQEVVETGTPKKFKKTTVSLNGARFEKLTSDRHIIRVVIVSDSESRVVQEYSGTTFVISAEDCSNPDFIDFLLYSGNLIYLKPIGPKTKCWRFFNFPRIIVNDKDLDLTSGNDEIYSLRRRYDDYAIRAIDYQDQFISELRRRLDDYGIELVRQNKETTLRKTSYVTYQINQTPSKILHPGRREFDDRIISQKVPIDFSLRTTDMRLFYDFKNKYNNVELLTNFCEFKTEDKYGERWTAAIKWGGVTEDFNHQYQSDDNSNFSYQCQFRCEIYFFECIDDRYSFLREVSLELDSSDSKKK